MKYEAALFDLDGVIINSEPLHEAAFKAVLKKQGHNLDPDTYMRHFAGKSDLDGLGLYLEEHRSAVDTDKVIKDKALAYEKIAAEGLVAFPGVQDIIQKLSAVIPVALVTGSSRREAEQALDVLGIAECFSAVVTADHVAQGKPSPEGYLRAAELLGVSVKKCVAIEDSVSGIRAAIDAGADCIAVTNTHPAEQLGAATIIVDKLTLNLF